MDGDRGDLRDEALRDEIEPWVSSSSRPPRRRGGWPSPMSTPSSASASTDPTASELAAKGVGRVPFQATTTGSGSNPLNPTVE